MLVTRDSSGRKIEGFRKTLKQNTIIYCTAILIRFGRNNETEGR